MEARSQVSYYVLYEDDGCTYVEGVRLSERAAITLFKATARRFGCTQGDDYTAPHPDKPRSVQLLVHC